MLTSPHNLRDVTPKAQTLPWPKEPYKGLNYFRHTDAPLFGERDEDIQNCCSIVGSATNKVLLLHGRSGAGKSSFLRAGLLPQLQLARFSVFSGAKFTEPLLVRCTADPVDEIQRALLLRLLSEDYDFISDDGHSLAVERLQNVDFEDKNELAECILDVLSILSKESSRPLVVTVDQGEEVFTVGASKQARDAFFLLIEELCLRNIDAKLIVSIRTEYYGQFCDQLRVDPNLSVSTKRTSLDQYMLHGLRTRSQIISTIVRPTLKEQVVPYGSPFEVYRFEFEANVVEQLADDLLQHCGESSILPVMQIVCRDLYRSVVATGEESEITLKHYEDLGRVDGQVNAFIESSIRDAVKEVTGENPTDREISLWQGALAELVATQESGVLTTLLVDEQTIIEDAQTRGLSGPILECLEAMAEEKNRLLRLSRHMDSSGEVIRQFSLGHDALAPSLFQWEEDRYDLIQEQKFSRKLKIALAGAAALILVAVTLVGFQRYMIREQMGRLLEVRAESDSSPQFRSRVLLTVAAIDYSKGFFSQQLSHDSRVDKLRLLLERTPFLVQTKALAIGVSRSGDKLVELDQAGQVFIVDFGTGQRTPSGRIKLKPALDQPVAQTAVGFIAGLRSPIAYQGGFISWWPDSVEPGEDNAQEIELKPRLPEGFASPGFVWVEIAANKIRLTQSMLFSTPRTFYFSEGNFLQQGFKFDKVISMPWPYQFWPAYSSYSDSFAFILSQGEVDRASRSNPSDILRVRPPRPRNPDQNQAGGLTAELFLESVGFAHADEAILVRNSREEITIYPKSRDTKPSTLVISEDLQDRPTRPRFGGSRPLIAGSNAGNIWRVAWINDDGISILDSSTSVVREVVPKWQPLLPAVPLDSIIRLEFSADGRYLTAISQSSFQEPVSYRTWNLGAERKAELASLDESKLRSLACGIVASIGSNKFSPAEIASWFEGRNYQPCGEK